MKPGRLVSLVWALSLAGAWAFTPPEDRGAGVVASIRGIDETHVLGQPLRFTVQIANATAAPVTGTLRVWLNDDWRVAGETVRAVRVDPGEDAEFAFTAEARERVLAAHYPVHARLSGNAGADAIDLHPIAIFMAVAPHRNEPVGEHGLPGGVYEALRAATPITVDGDLTEWSAAVPVACGQAQCSTGTIDPQGFAATFMALHDETALYVAVRATDDQVEGADRTSPDFMNSDYVRLYLSARDPEARSATRLGSDDRVVAINVVGDAGRPLLRRPDYAGATATLDLSQWRAAARRTDNGYALEVAIPLGALGPEARPQSILGANVMIGDADGGLRRGEITLGRRMAEYWLTPQAYFRLVLSAATSAANAVPDLPPLVNATVGGLRLDLVRACAYGIETPAGRQRFGPGWSGRDEASGATLQPGKAIRGGEDRSGLVLHPPYRKGAGGVWVDYYLELPAGQEAALEFSNAIRDHVPEREPPSDGVEFKVFAAAGTGSLEEVFSRFTAAKVWEPARVDLSRFAGGMLRLRLWAGPGPAQNTTCDSGYWAEPTLLVGQQPTPTTEAQWHEREQAAGQRARAAAMGQRGPSALALKGPTGRFGVAMEAGPAGFLDGVLAFSDGARTVAFRGFALEIDGQDCSDRRSGIRVRATGEARGRSGFCLHHVITMAERDVPVDVDVRAEEGSVTLALSLPGVKRDRRGAPRVTRAGLGPASVPIRRVHLGFGNVAEGLGGPFTVSAGGFGLSTRHVGADYENGLSLLQATDLQPNRLVCDPATALFRLEGALDCTFRFIPATGGAFAAARHYRDLSGFRPGKGVPNLLGRICLDQWGGDYEEAATDLDLAGRYGLTHAIFVKHVWQRWGYDYRLPEIYPPQGGLEAFRTMPDACRRYGILFAPHDNYIDLYPDAAGFTYDDVVFNADGTPQRAWFNKGRQAQSYRWLPHAFGPWLEANMKSMRDGFAPTGLFIDVFSAIRVFDYYDRDGRFHGRDRTAREWREAFDASRRIFGHGAPMLSEAGHDALVGSLDGAQSDHYTADRWGIKAAGHNRTPWHDMATHGRFVLLAGGLGSRYSNDDAAHSYGSDDYLSNTVIGGRNPMCDGPFNRRAVMTYWLLHDVCNDLAHQDFETHEFAGDSIYRQHTTFSRGGQAWSNRGPEPWVVGGHTLPEFGFWTDTGTARAGVILVDGQRAGFAEAAGTLFVDARPRALPGRRTRVAVDVKGGRYLGDGQFAIDVVWTMMEPLAEGTQPFVHVVHPRGEGSEKILHHGQMELPPEGLWGPGTHTARILVRLPSDSPGGEYQVRFGLYNPKRGGARVVPAALSENGRVRGGRLFAEIADGKVTAARYEAEAAADDGQTNLAGRVLDFDRLATNGAFRLLTPTGHDWELIPLPGSLPFEARLKLKDLGARATVAGVTAIDPVGPDSPAPEWQVADDVLSLRVPGDAFAYRIHFAGP